MTRIKEFSIDECDVSYVIEGVRQKAMCFKNAKKYWEEHAPEGKKYTGFKFKPFCEEGSMGWELVPVYEKITEVRG